MIVFLAKGLIRDKSRSLLPIIVVAIGVMLSVFMHAYVNGIMGDTIEMNAKFNTGHLKVITKAYSENIDQMPNDLALEGVGELTTILHEELPDFSWYPRIKFGGLVDVPDSTGDTKSQGPSIGFGVDLLSDDMSERECLNLKQSLVRGAMPSKKGEVLISESFSLKLGINPGEEFTLISSTMNNALCMYNLRVAGTLSFGTNVLDKGTIIADIEDIRQALDMHDAASEIVGFLNAGFYSDKSATESIEKFNKLYPENNDAFAPVIISLKQQGSMASYVDISKNMSMIITMVFIIAMSLVLWNAGLLGGLRRYGEFGVRLAIGETKGHVYKTMIAEALIIGLIGTIAGTLTGLGFAWLMQTYGIDISGLIKGASVMFPSILRTRITTPDFYIGLFPGLFSTVLGTMLSGIAIYRRQTSRLFKELEA